MSSKIELTGIMLIKKEQWFQMSKKSRHLDKLGIICQAIRQLKSDGTFDSILTKHVGSNWRTIN